MRSIVVILVLVFFLGCLLDKKQKIRKPNNDICALSKNDSIKSNNVFMSNDVAGKTKNEYFIVERSDGLSIEKDIKIVEINNTKVIKQSSDFSEGRVVYKIPETMKIRSTYKVIVRICKSKYVVSIYDSLSGVVRTSKIPTTETMELRLIDPSPDDDKFFKIVSDNQAVQIIENGDTYTEWTWNVTPIKLGNSKLKIVISVIRNGNKKDVVYEDSVEVEKDIKAQLKFFIKEYWKWSLTTFVIPFFVWLYNRNKKKKESEKEKQDGESKTV